MRHILWMKGGGLGDFVLGLPVLSALRRHFSGALIDVVGPRAFLPLTEGLGNRLFPLEAQMWDGLYGGSGLPDWLSGVDLAVVLRPDRLGLAARYLTSAGVRRVLVRTPAPRRGVHQVENLCQVLAPIRLRCDPWPSIRLASVTTEPRSRPVVAIHPGSGGQHKIWPPHRYVKLCHALSCSGYEVWVLLGPAELERGTGRLFEEAGVETQMPGTVMELARRLTGASVVVGNDSGVSHLAAALGRPVVVLFGPTDPAVWAPRGPRVQVVAAENAGEPGISMADIPLDRVRRAVDRMLAVGAG